MASSADRRADADLVAAAVRGDGPALDELLRRHLDRIHAVCRRVCGPDDAPDATQNALIAIVRSIGRFDGRAAFSTWTHRIAVNAALDEVRRQKRRPTPTDIDDTLMPARPVAGHPEDVVDRMELDRALAAIPEDFRVAVVLRDASGLDYAEIAAVLDIPIGTVRSRIARGRAALGAALGNSDAAPTVQGTDHD